MFSQSSYSASEEDGLVEVFISVLGQSDIAINLRLQTISNSANSKFLVFGNHLINSLFSSYL